MTTSPAPPSATRFTARSQEDILAVVPVVLGFVPEDSVAMLTFGAEHPFHARVDLPPPDTPPAAVAELVESLRAPALRHRVRRVVFVLYSEDAVPAERVARRLVRAFREAEIDVVDVVRADGRRWYPLLRGRCRRAAAGVPYDASTHPFTAQAVLDGRVTHRSRADLVASLEADPDRVARVASALSRRDALDPPAWVRATTGRLVAAREVPDDDVAARLLRAVGGDGDARDAACRDLTPAGAEGHVELWTDLLRRSPEGLVGSAAAVLAVAAWLAGNGALAWCAVDRAEAAAPDHPLAGLVGELLTAAVPPGRWTEVSDS